MRWLPLALAVLGWHSLLAELGSAARAQPALRWPAFLLAFALPAAGAAILLRGPDLGTRAGRRLRLWAHLATLAPVIATALRVPQGLPTRPVWLALFGAPLTISLLRSLRGEVKLHRWSAAVILSFAALHFASHLSAAFSLALNTRVVDAVRLVYKQPLVEALLLFALPVQIATGLWLFRAARDRALIAGTGCSSPRGCTWQCFSSHMRRRPRSSSAISTSAPPPAEVPACSGIRAFWPTTCSARWPCSRTWRAGRAA